MSKSKIKSSFLIAKFFIHRIFKRIVRKIALYGLKKNRLLWSEIISYMSQTKSTGVSWSDFFQLYKTVRRIKPEYILECGSGASTIVMAIALMENEKEGKIGKIISMEEIQEYLEMSVSLTPNYLKKYIDYCLSPRVDDYYEVFRGVRYRDIPDIIYDFVFIDGPEHHSPVDGEFCFNFDLIHILKRQDKELEAIVDYRLSTSWVLQKILGRKHVRFNWIEELAFVGPVSGKALKKLSLDANTINLMRKGKIVGNTVLELY